MQPANFQLYFQSNFTFQDSPDEASSESNTKSSKNMRYLSSQRSCGMRNPKKFIQNFQEKRIFYSNSSNFNFNLSESKNS
jgi:hypothetical protein